jgi:hypothetical protein
MAPVDLAAANDGVSGVRYELVDRVMATVNKDVILLSDLERQARVFLVMKSGPQALQQVADPGFASRVLDYLVQQQLLIQEMRRQGNWAQGLGDDAVAAEMKLFASRFGGDEAYRAFLDQSGMSEESLKDILLRERRVEKFLAGKTRQASEVSDDDAEDYYNKNQVLFANVSFQQAAPEIKVMIGKQRSEKFLTEYIEELRGRYDIRLLAVPR